MGRQFGIRASAAIMFGLLVACPAVVSGQQNDTETSAVARALFQEGLRLAAERQWEQAADRFRRAHAVRPAPGIAVNLASALIPLGRLVEASELLERVIEDGDAPPEARALARRLHAGEVLRRIGRLRIDLRGDARGVVLTRNGAAVPAPALGVAIPADPGTHEIRALRDGELVAARTIDLGPGRTEEVLLDLPRVIPSAREAARRQVMTDARPARERGEPRAAPRAAPSAWWPWALGAALATAATVAVVLVLTGGSEPAPVPGNADPAVISGTVRQ